MKAAVLFETGRPMSVEEVAIDAPKGHEVLIRTVAAGLCHSDLLFIDGDWPHPLPTILGHEVAGIVEAVGPEVTYVRPGDHVVGCAGGPCYECRFCVQGRPIICINRDHDRHAGEPPRLSLSSDPIHQYGQLSGFAEFLLVHEHATVKIPEEVPLHHAAISGCGVATGLGAVFNTARVEPGASVVITGCGGVGLNAVQGARIAGAGPIVAVDVVARKLDMALALGAHHVVDASREDAVEAVRELTGGGGDHVIEASGVASVAEQAFDLLGVGGVLTLVGLPRHGTRIPFDMTRLIPNEQTVRGSHVGSLRPRVDLPRYLNMYLRGQLDLESMITAKIRLDEVNEGFASMQDGGLGRSIIVFD